MNAKSATRKGRVQLIAVAALFVLPLAAAIVTAKLFPQWSPFGTANYGTLVEPVVPVDAIALRSLDGVSDDAASFAGKWSLLMFTSGSCGELCRQQLYLTQQVRLLLNKDVDRVQRWLIFAGGDAGQRGAKELVGQYPGLRLLAADNAWSDAFTMDDERATRSAHVFLVDPQGYLMMYFPSDFEPQSMLKDLKRLLKTSRLG